MAVIRLDSFERSLKKLPKGVRDHAEEQIFLFKEDQRDPRLHIKKLKKPYDGIYSFRITRNYRALFYFDIDNRIVIFEIDNRKDAYR